MARIAGINIPQNKVVSIALTYIHGIGLHSSKKICTKLNIPSNKRVNQLSEEEVLKIREFIDANHKVEGDLRREVSVNIKRLVDLACYRGTRHKKKYPYCPGGDPDLLLFRSSSLKCRTTFYASSTTSRRSTSAIWIS